MLLVKGLEDSDYKACWDIPIENEEAFCQGAVTWPVSEEIYYNADAIDEEAKLEYRKILWDWENR